MFLRFLFWCICFFLFNLNFNFAVLDGFSAVEILPNVAGAYFGAFQNGFKHKAILC